MKFSLPAKLAKLYEQHSNRQSQRREVRRTSSALTEKATARKTRKDAEADCKLVDFSAQYHQASFVFANEPAVSTGAKQAISALPPRSAAAQVHTSSLLTFDTPVSEDE